MKRIMMKFPQKKTSVSKKKITVIATTITTLLSAAAAFAAIRKTKKAGRENKSEFETVLDDLVNEGTITEDQVIAIQSAITTAKEARIANDDFTSEENGELDTVIEPRKIGTLIWLKKSIKVRSQQLKQKAQQLAN